MSLKIRKARASDLDALVQLEERTFSEDRFPRTQIRYLLTKARGVMLVAEQSRQVVGAAYLLWRQGGKSARLYSIAVDERVRGLGVAAKLLLRCEQEAMRQRLIRLSLEVRADNERAIAFYQKHSYREVERLVDYYDLGADGLRMAKTLASG